MNKPMRPAEREEWIKQYLVPRQKAMGKTPYHIDILTADFVWAYIEATNVKSQLMVYGAPKCPTLASDLGRMYRNGALERSKTGLGPGSVSEGFPPWVYCYHLPRSVMLG